ncbi:MAG: DUF3754 domain-containing protein [Methylococcaceae bacterium]|nr:DUF3754 domain-containing protein [Methylococcaceae bacterium]
MREINYQQNLLERFIPVNIEELITTLSNRQELSATDKSDFQLFCQHYRALYHALSLPDYQKLRHHYAPFNPDRDSLSNLNYSDAEKQALQDKLLDDLKNLLNDANYEQLSQEQLNAVLHETSPYGVKVSVDFNEFEEILLFYRGSAIRKEERREWKSLFLKKEIIETKIYRRLFILLKSKSLTQKIQELAAAKNISQSKAERKIKHKHDQNSIDDEKIYIKLFKNIPRTDLEMLFPNTKVRMRLLDKFKLGITGGGGTVGGIMTVVTKLTATIDPIAMATTIFGFIGLLWRQISKIFLQRTKYMAELAKNLYYYNLDNNLGAISHLHDMAAASEAKEALLSYFFLLTEGEMTAAELDKKIELFIEEEYRVAIDFEVDDGLGKLERLGLLIQKEDKVSVVDLSDAENILKQKWLACF